MFPRLEASLSLSLRKLSKEKVNEYFKDISLRNIFLKKFIRKKSNYFFLVFYIFYESNIKFFLK